jgi:hypothetical protein
MKPPWTLSLSQERVNHSHWTAILGAPILADFLAAEP